MPRSEHGAVWVFHRGALGDGVLLWPMLRALVGLGPVVLVTDRPRASLAARELGVVPLDADGEPAARLWVEGGTVRPVPGVRSVQAWLGRPGRGRGVWLENARRAFPGAYVAAHDARPDSCLARRWAVWTAGGDHSGPGPDGLPRRFDVTNHPVPLERAGLVEAAGTVGRTLASDLAAGIERPLPAERENVVVFYVGAGSAVRRWPMDRWRCLGELVGRAIPDARLEWLAGEAESEAAEAAGASEAAATAGWRGREADAFGDAGGRYVRDLEELAERLRRARLYVGADTGPSHLAAQLGTPTLALFGPSDPARWAPVGPRVRVVAPVTAGPMAWLDAPTVARHALGLLAEESGPAPGER